jgi:hypothetical protein
MRLHRAMIEAGHFSSFNSGIERDLVHATIAYDSFSSSLSSVWEPSCCIIRSVSVTSSS